MPRRTPSYFPFALTPVRTDSLSIQISPDPRYGSEVIAGHVHHELGRPGLATSERIEIGRLGHLDYTHVAGKRRRGWWPYKFECAGAYRIEFDPVSAVSRVSFLAQLLSEEPIAAIVERTVPAWIEWAYGRGWAWTGSPELVVEVAERDLYVDFQSFDFDERDESNLIGKLAPNEVARRPRDGYFVFGKRGLQLVVYRKDEHIRASRRGAHATAHWSGYDAAEGPVTRVEFRLRDPRRLRGFEPSLARMESLIDERAALAAWRLLTKSTRLAIPNERVKAHRRWLTDPRWIEVQIAAGAGVAAHRKPKVAIDLDADRRTLSLRRDARSALLRALAFDGDLDRATLAGLDDASAVERAVTVLARAVIADQRERLLSDGGGRSIAAEVLRRREAIERVRRGGTRGRRRTPSGDD